MKQYRYYINIEYKDGKERQENIFVTARNITNLAEIVTACYDGKIITEILKIEEV